MEELDLKKLQKIVIPLVVILAIILSVFTINRQKKRTEERFTAEITNNAKTDQSGSTDEFGTSGDTNEIHDFVYEIPKTNKYRMDRQVTDNPVYDQKAENTKPLKYYDTYKIESVDQISNSNKPTIVFLYKGGVNSSDDYEPIIKSILDKYKTKYPIQILDVEKSNINSSMFYKYVYTARYKKTNVDAPQVDDIYALFMKNGTIYDMILKTDTTDNSFNMENINNILNGLEGKSNEDE